MATEQNKNQPPIDDKVKKRREIVLKYLDEQLNAAKKPTVTPVPAKKAVLTPASTTKPAASLPAARPKLQGQSAVLSKLKSIEKDSAAITTKPKLPAVQITKPNAITTTPNFKNKPLANNPKTQRSDVKKTLLPPEKIILPHVASLNPVRRSTPSLSSVASSNTVAFFSLERRFMAYLAAAMVICFGFYIIFCFLIYTFTLDNAFTRSVAARLTVPAIITSVGMVDYYEYLDIRKEVITKLPRQTESIDESVISTLTRRAAIKRRLAEIMALERGVAVSELPLAIVKDQSINADKFNLAVSIANSWRKTSDYRAVEAEYKLVSEAQFFKQAELKSLFNDSIANLTYGQISEVLATSRGYYVVQHYGNSADMTGLKYFFVKAQSMDELLDKKAREVRYFSLL